MHDSFLKGYGHQGILSLVKGTLRGNCEFLLQDFNGTKAMTRGHGGNPIESEASGMKSRRGLSFEMFLKTKSLLYTKLILNISVFLFLPLTRKQLLFATSPGFYLRLYSAVMHSLCIQCWISYPILVLQK